MNSLIVPYKSKSLGIILLTPGSSVNPQQRRFCLENRLLKSQLRKVRQDMTPSKTEPHPASGHLQILFCNIGFSALLVKYLFFSY